jgi:hypothetical protein
VVPRLRAERDDVVALPEPAVVDAGNSIPCGSVRKSRVIEPRTGSITARERPPTTGPVSGDRPPGRDHST